MPDFLIDNIFVTFGGIPRVNNCTLLLADLFLFSYEADFTQKLLWKNEKKKERNYVISIL